MIKKIFKWLPSNIGGIIGVIQAILQAVREICIVLIRLICPIIPGENDEKLIQKIADISETIHGWLEKAKGSAQKKRSELRFG